MGVKHGILAGKDCARLKFGSTIRLVNLVLNAATHLSCILANRPLHAKRYDFNFKPRVHSLLHEIHGNPQAHVRTYHHNQRNGSIHLPSNNIEVDLDGDRR